MREHIEKDKEFLECITKGKHFKKIPTKKSISKNLSKIEYKNYAYTNELIQTRLYWGSYRRF